MMKNLDNKAGAFIDINTEDEKKIKANETIMLLETEPLILKSFLICLIAGLIGIIGFPLSSAGNGFSLVFIGLLLGIASLGCGFFTGTLFGMPKRNETDSGNYTLNNSLVEISEWLTKIIVGLGLVNLREVPGYLNSLGQFVKQGSKDQSYVDFYAMCILVYFSVLGLYTGYNYMRLVLSPKYKIVDDNMLREKFELAVEKIKETTTENEKLKVEATDLQEKSQILQEEIAITGNVTKELLKIANKPEIPIEDIQITSAEIASREDVNESEDTIQSYVSNMISDAQAKLKAGLERNPNDPQLGQWGGKAVNNERELSAAVVEISNLIYEIIINIKSTTDNNPLQSGEVILVALHDTFGDPPFRLVTVENGTAQLKLISYGSFTIGAYADRGNTELELNLAELPEVSDYFKTH